MKQIATFVNEISDEFKVVVVNAIKSLCFKFPQKHAILMNFLSLMLREEGGLNYKACITETFIKLIEMSTLGEWTSLILTVDSSNCVCFVPHCSNSAMVVQSSLSNQFLD